MKCAAVTELHNLANAEDITNKNPPQGRVFVEKLTVAQLLQELPASARSLRSLPCSQEPSSGHNPEATQSSL
jgi:hypothetical protein